MGQNSHGWIMPCLYVGRILFIYFYFI
jgi:hypothetical protein